MVCITLSQEEKKSIIPSIQNTYRRTTYRIVFNYGHRYLPFTTLPHLKILGQPSIQNRDKRTKITTKNARMTACPTLFFFISLQFYQFLFTEKASHSRMEKKEEWKNEWMNARKKLLFSKHSPAPVFKYLFVWLLKRLSVCVCLSLLFSETLLLHMFFLTFRE